MSTYWDKFIDQLPQRELAGSSPWRLCKLFYEWLIEQPDFIKEVKAVEDQK